MMRSALLTVFVLLVSMTVLAAPAPERVAPSVKRLMALRAAGEAPIHPRHPDRRMSTERFVGSIRFTVEPSEGLLARVEALGVRLYRVDGRLLRLGAVLPARIPTDRVQDLLALPEVRRVEAQSPVVPTDWVDKAPEVTGLPQVWNNHVSGVGDLTGKGTTIGLIDTWIHTLHPGFFRADGGYYDWVDLDGDGVFTPGKDAVDVDGNGAMDLSETLQVLGCPVVWAAYSTGMQGAENVDNGFQPDMDWLWVDLDGSGEREAGVEFGFTEEDLAYGEPLFVADDVNDNGTLDPGEKLVRLGTSKIKKIYRPEGEELWTRGENLVTYPAWGADISHSTMTAGVMVGNTPFHQRRGVAVDADILLVDWEQNFDAEVPYGDPLLAGLAWLVEEKADVTSHSYGLLVQEFCDGSSELEKSMDYVLETHGIPACVSSGNEGDFPFHGLVELAPGEITEIPLTIGVDGKAVYMFFLNLRWHGTGDDQLEVALEDGDGNQIELPANGVEAHWGDVNVRMFEWATSERDTTLAMGRFRHKDSSWGNPKELPGGTWRLLVKNPGDEAVPLDIVLQNWWDPTSLAVPDHATSRGTVTWPSTSDTAITVGASVANEGAVGAATVPGTLVAYSSRGPRIDGELALDIVAPCDLASPWFGYHEKWLDSVDAPPEYYNALDPFFPMERSASGTSGAAPFAAAVIALWKQANPDGDGRDVPELLRQRAITDALTGETPNDNYGHGKISAAGLLFEQELMENAAPAVDLVAPAEVLLNQPFTVDVSSSSDPDGDVLVVRWDQGYDGDWDGPYDLNLSYEVEGLEEPGWWNILGELADGKGGTDRFLVRVKVLDQEWAPEPEPTADVQESPEDTAQPGPDTVQPPEITGGSSNGCAVGGAVSSIWLLLVVLGLGLLRRRS